MYDQVQISVFILVNFDKVIPSAERSHTELCTVGIDMRTAFKALQIRLLSVLVPERTNIHTRGNIPANTFVQSLKVDFPFLQLYCFHSAADVHADKVRNNLVGYRHCFSDYAASPRMDIGHNRDSLTRRKGLIKQLDYLRPITLA